MQHIPTRNKKNPKYIIDLMKKSRAVSWTGQGELVSNNVIRGSHINDLFKKNPSKIVLFLGWYVFLNTLAILNVPLSAMQSTQPRQLITGSSTRICNIYEYSDTLVNSRQS